MLSAGIARVRVSELCWPSVWMRQSEEELEAKLDALLGSDYLADRRPKLIGEIASASLLESDARNNVLPLGVVTDANVRQLTFVDEARCIGCRSCAEVARSTFRMEEDFGAARVYQQCGDEPIVIEEAVDCCPVDCIHEVSYNELRILEEHREMAFRNGDMAAAQGVGKLSARAEGRDGAPNWRAPLQGMSLEPSYLPAPEMAAFGEAPESGAASDAPSRDDQAALEATELGWDVLSSLFPDAEEEDPS